MKVSHAFLRKRPDQSFDGHVLNCSGIVVGTSQVLTAKHCAGELHGDELRTGQITTIDGEQFKVLASSPDADQDLLLLQLDRALEIEAARVAPAVPIALTLAGYGCSPGSLPLQRSAIRLSQRGENLYVAGCVCHGDSGGPMLDDQGRLVAIVVGTDNTGKSGRGVLVQRFMRGQ